MVRLIGVHLQVRSLTLKAPLDPEWEAETYLPVATVPTPSPDDAPVFDKRIRFGLQKRPDLKDHPAQQETLELYYRFSDSLEISAREILTHSHSELLPENGLPVWHGDAHEWSQVSPRNQYRQMIIRAFRNLAQDNLYAPASQRLILTIGGPEGRNEERKVLKVKNLKFHSFQESEKSEKAPQLVLKVDPTSADPKLAPEGQTQVSMQISGLAPTTLLFEGFWYYPTSQTLFSHDAFQNDLHIPEMTLNGHSKIQSWIEETEKRLQSSLTKTSFIPSIQRIRKEEIDFHLDLSPVGFQLRFGFEVATEKRLELGNFPTLFLDLYRGLQGGMRSISFMGDEFVSQRAGSSERDWDVRISQHVGVYAAFLTELLPLILKNKSRNELFWKDLDSRLGSIVSLSREKLSQLVSKRMIEGLHAFSDRLEALIDQRPPRIFAPEGVFELEGVNRMSLKVLLSSLEAAAKFTSGEVFLKAKTPTMLPIEDEKEITLDLTQTDTLLRVPDALGKTKKRIPPESWMSLAVQEDLDISYDGRNLELVEADEFKTEFEVSDFKTEDRIDWFELNPRVFLKGQEIAAEASVRLSRGEVIEHDGKMYFLKNRNLPSVEFLERFWSRLSNAAQKDSTSGKRKGPTYYRLPKSQVLEILALRTAGIPIKAAESWNELFEFYDSLKGPRTPIEIPKAITAELKKYQNIGFAWMHDLYRLRLGGILADDMGLGKTLQTLVFLEWVRSQGKLNHSLVVVPTSLTTTWIEEAKKFAPLLPIELFNPKEKEAFKKSVAANETPKVFVVTYSLLYEHEEVFLAGRYGVVVFDEAQNLKNISAKRTTVARKIDAYFKLCLTGTPLENHFDELFSLVDLVAPGALGSFSDFRKTFVIPAEVNPGHMKDLKLKTKPLILRRAKSEILKELPPKNEISQRIPFEEHQLKIYRDIALSWNQKIREQVDGYGESKSQLFILSALLRLRQVCSDPSALPNVDYPEIPPKISLLEDVLTEITDSGESALVFTQFRATFARIEGLLKKRGIPVFTLHGEMSRPQREVMIRSFLEFNKGAVLLMTLKTGGTGLNLVKASYVFHVEPWWNPSVENQATDRAHRMGQTKPVTIYRYLMQDSVEEKIEVLKNRKKLRFDALFTESESTEKIAGVTESGISISEFEYLIS